MDLDPSVYQDPAKARQALTLLSPIMAMIWIAVAVVVALLVYAMVRFSQASRKVARAVNPAEHKPVKAGMGAVLAAEASKKGSLGGTDYAGLTKEEMRLVFEAEVKRRREAGEEIVIRNPFEGPLDWDDIDETGQPRTRAKPVAPDYEEWRRQQEEAKKGQNPPDKPPAETEQGTNGSDPPLPEPPPDSDAPPDA
ncbi:MAG TPA: hypothetical protein VEI97_07990 [bacterium]|nr:hypothetical protein [bacterium]